MLTELDQVYIELLQVGFIVLRQAVDSGNNDWVNAEVEMLHNIPSLVGEKNSHRHQHYWNAERPQYIKWIK